MIDFATKKRLITYGCSHTWGNGLPDIFDPTDKFQQLRKKGKAVPSKHVWGQVLADTQKLKHTNRAFAGESNRGILNIILNNTYNADEDVVCILWSHTQRYTNYQEDNIERWGPWNADRIRESKIYYKHIWNEYAGVLDTASCIHHAKLFLDSYNIPNFHALQAKGTSLFKQFPKKHIKYILDLKVQKLFFEDFRKIEPLALDGNHAGVNAHLKFANAMLDTIINSKQITIKELINAN